MILNFITLTKIFSSGGSKIISFDFLVTIKINIWTFENNKMYALTCFVDIFSPLIKKIVVHKQKTFWHKLRASVFWQWVLHGTNFNWPVIQVSSNDFVFRSSRPWIESTENFFEFQKLSFNSFLPVSGISSPSSKFSWKKFQEKFKFSLLACFEITKFVPYSQIHFLFANFKITFISLCI